MPRITYQERNFKYESLRVIDEANLIIDEYGQQGFDLTLRQLYYQFVVRDLIPNTDRSYKRLGSIINDARMAGLIDWDSIVDRTRKLRRLPHWNEPSEIVHSGAEQFRVDMWEGQAYRPECFSPDTPILTRTGFVDIGSVEVGEEVFTHSGRWRRVTEVIRTVYEGNMLEVRSAGVLPFLVTPNHLMYTRPHDDSRPGYKGAERKFLPRQWRDSQCLKPHDRLLLPRIRRQYSKRVADAPLTLQGGPRSKSIEMTIDHTALRVFGLYLAEGNIRCDKRTVQFTFGSHEERHADLVKGWASSIGINTHTVSGPGTCIIYLFSKALADWLGDNFGTGAFQKHLPGWLIEAPFEMQTEALEFYFRGDGCFWDESRAAIAATTRSRNLALQAQLLLLWAGFAASLDVGMDAGAPRYRVSIGGADVVRLADMWKVDVPKKGLGRSQRYNHIKAGEKNHYAEFPVRSIKMVPYQGHVINLEVEEDNSYCIPVAAHNCWIEKDALIGVITDVCEKFDVPYFSCRGYTSQSEMWSASQRLIEYCRNIQIPVIIHLGDHDPSGIDMTRDIQDRLALFMTHDGNELPVNVIRLALNMDQVEQYDPPPNPAKITDSRSRGYRAEFGDSSWELDALEPSVMERLIEDTLQGLRRGLEWNIQQRKQDEGRRILFSVAQNWKKMVAMTEKRDEE